MSASNMGFAARYAHPIVITDPEHPDLVEVGGDSVPTLLITDNEDNMWFDGDPAELASVGERIHIETARAFPEHSRMRFIHRGRPDPVCVCGNGHPGQPEHTGFYPGDDAGEFAGRRGTTTTIVCRTCGRVGTLPNHTPLPRTLPGYGFIVTRVTGATIAAANAQALITGTAV
jgi:hypothetical protein